MTIEKIDFSKKEVWNNSDVEKIAMAFGYICTPRFVNELKKYNNEIVKKATITHHLRPVADNFFRNISPPLEKIK